MKHDTRPINVELAASEAELEGAPVQLDLGEEMTSVEAALTQLVEACLKDPRLAAAVFAMWLNRTESEALRQLGGCLRAQLEWDGGNVGPAGAA